MSGTEDVKALSQQYVSCGPFLFQSRAVKWVLSHCLSWWAVL